jgi:hypothetical protein
VIAGVASGITAYLLGATAAWSLAISPRQPSLCAVDENATVDKPGLRGAPQQAEGEIGAEPAPQRQVNPNQRVRLEYSGLREVAEVYRLEAQLADQATGDFLGRVVVAADEHDRLPGQLGMVHHRRADLVHGLANPGARCPGGNVLGARHRVPHLKRSEVGRERVGAVDEHLAGEIAARVDSLLGALPWRAQHDDVAAARRRLVGSRGRAEVGVPGVVGGADAVGDVMAGTPRTAEGTPDVSGSDDCDLDVGLRYGRGWSPARTHFEVSY